MARIEEAEEISETSSSETPSTQVNLSTNSALPESENLSALDAMTVDFYNALNGKIKAEQINVDLSEQLKNCHLKIKELTKIEETLKNQVFVNQTISIERQQAITDREKALADLKAEKATIEGWCKASDKVSEIINAQIPKKVKSGLGFNPNQEESDSDRSMLKFGTFVSSIPDPSSQKSPISEKRPSKESEKAPKVKNSQKLKNTSSSSSANHPNSGKRIPGSFQRPTPRIKIDLSPHVPEKSVIPPRTMDKRNSWF